MFQAYQAVKVVDEGLEAFGQAGRVVSGPNEKGEYSVKMDADDAVYEFEPAAIRAL
jgi:hypothetical protein